MAALRLSTPDKGVRIIDLGPGGGHHHDYERERDQAIRYLEWGRFPWRVTLRREIVRLP